jgi:DinB superfamily
MTNPYAVFLGGKSARTVIAETPGKLHSLAGTLGAAGMERSLAPGKWSAREILCHLADCELVFAFRLRQALAEPHHVIQPFDQDAWARTYAAFDAASALGVFSAMRRWNLALLAAAKPEDFSKPVSHPERGTMTFQTVIETMAGHDLNHLGQLENIAEARA